MTLYEKIKNFTKISSVGIYTKILAIILTMALGGCGIFGGNDDSSTKRLEAAEEVYQIGVNAYLWRASLDTLSFMPLKTADQSGGVILTEWKVNPGNVNERTKADIFILGRKLNADSLKVTVHRQITAANGWQDTPPRPGASIKITNAILMQARLLRRNNAPIK